MMKLIITTCAALSILVGVAALTVSVPFISQNGTAVIYAKSDDGKHGNKPLTAVIANGLTTRQYELLNFAYETAKADGMKYPQYLQGIIMQESKGCDMKNFRVAGLTNRVGDRYFGCGQVKLAAAKCVMGRYPDLWKYLESQTDEELQARLILDDRFNIRIASKYLFMMGINDNPKRAITAYNVGPGAVKTTNVDTHHYTLMVQKYSDTINAGFLNVQKKVKDLELKNNPPFQVVLNETNRIP